MIYSPVTDRLAPVTVSAAEATAPSGLMPAAETTAVPPAEAAAMPVATAGLGSADPPRLGWWPKAQAMRVARPPVRLQAAQRLRGAGPSAPSRG
jgi:hypothetical protein